MSSCMPLQNLRMVGLVRIEWQSSCFIVEITGMEKRKRLGTPINPSAQEAEIGRFLLKRSKFQASQGCTHKMNRQGLTNKYDMVRLPCRCEGGKVVKVHAPGRSW